MKIKVKPRGTFSRVVHTLKPYVAQYRRAPLWVKVISMLCIFHLAMPIDLWDVFVPWLAFSDDIFVAGLLLKLLHKYGALPDEDRTTAGQLLKQLFTKDTDLRAEAPRRNF